jgi:endoribonuclease Dicer
MTASPVESKKDIGKTIDDLEELLHSKVVTTSDTSLFEFAHKPKDEAWIYDRRGSEVRTELYQKLFPAKSLVPELNAEYEAASKASADLGTWFADRIFSYTIGSSTNELGDVVSRFERGDVYANMSSLEDKVAAIQQLDDLARVARAHHLAPLTWKLPDMSSKVRTLYTKLAEQFADEAETKAMVFVQQRTTAVLLCDGLRVLGLPNIRPAYLTGGGRSGNESITGKKQEEVMRHFHAGLVNVLIATSVGEEGIDVPQCNLVVRFDLYTTVIQYMQSRGRARMEDSVYAHMLEDGNAEHKELMRWVIESADYLKLYCGSLPADRLLGKGTKLAQLILKDSANRSFQTDSGAVCNFSNCLVILSRYASSLHHLGAMTTEVYEERIIDGSSAQFQYVVRLPVDEHSPIRGAIGESRHNKALAKRSAAFKCVGQLRAKGLLDENLNSIFHKVKPDNLNARLAVSAKKDSYDMKVKPDLWQLGLGEVPAELYATTIHIVPSEPLKQPLAAMVLLTRHPLPRLPHFPMYLEDGIEAQVTLETLEDTLKVNDEDLGLLTEFTMNAVFADVFNKVYQHDPSRVGYWLAPLAVESSKGPMDLASLIDYAALGIASQDRRKWTSGTPASVWCNKFLVDPMSGKYHYITQSVVDGVNAFDPEPSEFLSGDGKKREAASIIYFTDSHWSLKDKNRLAAEWDRSQPVFAAELQTVRRNFLDRPTDQELATHMCWIAPEPLEVGRITPPMARTALAWPSIIHRVESYMIALEAFDKMGLSSVSAGLALEAFTKDDNTDDQDEQVHSGKCRGMGKNYERLEFIGDSLLKMTTTISIFNRTTCDEEGMHCRRMELLCNRRLFTVATESLGLEKHIRSQGFNRDTWYPENLVLLSGRGARAEPVQHGTRKHGLGMKTIADVCEASIGAAVMATKELPVPDRFELGIRAITRLVESEDHNIRSWSDFRAMYKPSAWELDLNDPIASNLAREVSARIGYTFKCPRLLRSAFTHSSDMNSPVPDLQRLEFLGDAVLDWVCIWWLFDSNPDKNPQWLTEHKMAMVSNMFLAALAVTLDFDKLFSVKTSKLAAAIFGYAGKVRAELQKPDCLKDFWTRIDGEKPPKALSDLVESTLGAMLIDSDFDYTRIERFFEKHVRPFFEDITLYDGFASMQPTSYIHKKLTREYGCCNFQMKSSEPQEGMLDSNVLAGILIHGNCIASSSGQSRRYAMVRASQQAIELLDGMLRAEFRKRFGCDCEKGAEMEQAEAAAGLAIIEGFPDVAASN